MVNQMCPEVTLNKHKTAKCVPIYSRLSRHSGHYIGS